MEQDQLIKTFEMLVERLTSLEQDVKHLLDIFANDNDGREGRLNTRAWNLDFDVFVHKPLLIDECDFFTKPHMYYVLTDLSEDEMFTSSTFNTVITKTLAGDFDKALATADIENVKRNAKIMTGDNESREEWLKCEKSGLESSRVYVFEHLLDVMISDWTRHSADWESITCMYDYGVSFWMKPSAAAKHDCGPRKCIVTMSQLLRFLDIGTDPRKVQLGPLGYYEGEFFRNYQQLTCKVIAGITNEKQERVLADMRRTYADMKRSIDLHHLWKNELSWCLLQEWG